MIISGNFQRMQRSKEDLFSGWRGLETPRRARLAQRQNGQISVSLKRQPWAFRDAGGSPFSCCGGGSSQHAPVGRLSKRAKQYARKGCPRGAWSTAGAFLSCFSRGKMCRSWDFEDKSHLFFFPFFLAWILNQFLPESPRFTVGQCVECSEGEKVNVVLHFVKAFLSVIQSRFLFLRVAHRNPDKGAGAGASGKAGRCVLLGRVFYQVWF